MPLVHTGREREEMEQIAIEEWMAASPIYSRRTQAALRFGNGDVATILKNIQLDIGAPHHFMDFRCRVDDATARRVLVGPLRRAARRRADGRGIRARDVPRDRGPDVRRHRRRDEPARAGAAGPPAAARSGRSRAALPLDDHDRRVVPAGRGAPVPGDRRAVEDRRHRDRGACRRRSARRRAGGLGRLLRRLRSRLRARGPLAPRARRRVAGGRGAEPSAVPWVPRRGRAALRRGDRARTGAADLHRSRRHDRTATGARARAHQRRRERHARSCCASTRCSGRARTSICGSRSSTTTRVRFALGPCPVLDEADGFTWFAQLGGAGDRALDAIVHAVEPARPRATRSRRGATSSSPTRP